MSLNMQGIISNFNKKFQSKNKTILKSINKPKETESVAFESFCNETPLQQYNNSLTCNDNINYNLFYNQPRNESNLLTVRENEELPFRETSLIADDLNDNVPQFGTSCSQTTSMDPTRDKGSLFLPKPNPQEKYEQFFDDSGTATVRRNRPSLPTILLLLVLCFVFIVLPVVYLLHCFDFLHGSDMSNSHLHRVWTHQTKDEGHYSPSVVVHQQLDRLDGPAPIISDTKYHDHNNLHAKNRPSPTTSTTKASRKQKPRKLLPLPPSADADMCEAISEDRRFDCHPEDGASRENCAKRGCCWGEIKAENETQKMFNNNNNKAPLNTPYCFYPSNYGGYTFVNVTKRSYGISALLKRTFRSPYPRDVPLLKMDFRFENDNRLHVKIFDPARNRFEPPYPEVPLVEYGASHPHYEVDIDQRDVGFKIIRKEDNVLIFDSANVGGLIFSDQLLQISGILPSHQLYGLGEFRGRLKIGTEWKQFTLFNHDQAPTENSNLYGSHPFYLVMENSGKSHGVFLLNSNAMDVIVQPTPAITFRPIGGVLSLYFLLGPSPSQVLQQYADIVGLPQMPPYWALGFHLCKYGYGSLNKTKEVFLRTKEAGIPFDVQWNDLDYMDQANDFTYDHDLFDGLPDFVRSLHKEGMHYVPLIDAGVSAAEKPGKYPPFDIGMEMNIFVKNISGAPFIGKVWNKVATVWPDFTHPKTVDYWTKMLSKLHKDIPFDGAWIDMNEPSNFLSGAMHVGCPMNNSLENPPYLPGVAGGVLSRNTLCMTAQHHAGTHYDVHNLYALSEAIITNFALTEIRNKRAFVISRSSFPGLGHYAGHWGGDISSTWYDMQQSIPELLRFSMFGVPMMGADICGFNGDTTPELCQRWMQLGAFYPFSRNHNSDKSIEQDPVAMGPGVVAASINALSIRYSMLPYLYTLFYRAHIFGETVARPIFVEFPLDENARDIEEQFMWGSALMIIPALRLETHVVDAYVPRGLWFDWNNFVRVESPGFIKQLDATLDHIPLLLRSGNILPLTRPRNKTALIRKEPIRLLALGDENFSANGEIYWDDGESLNTYEEKRFCLVHFNMTTGLLKVTPQRWGYIEEPLILGQVTVLGLTESVKHVKVQQKNQPFSFDTIRNVLVVENINLSMEKQINISWE